MCWILLTAKKTLISVWNIKQSLTDVFLFVCFYPFFRFAEFVEGQSHLSDNEMLDYETATILPDLTDDESDESEWI